LVKPEERPFRDEICLNGSWRFMPRDNAENLPREELKSPGLPGADGWEPVPLKVPSPWNVNGFADEGGGDFRCYPSYPASWTRVKAGWLKRTVTVPRDWEGSRVLLHFEAVAGFAAVYVQGRKIGENFDSFLPFHVDVTEQAAAGKELEILLWVAHGSLFDEKGKYGYRTYVGGSFWGRYIAGIWQDVYLLKMPGLYISDTFVQPRVDRDLLELEVTVRNTTAREVSFSLEGEVRRWISRSGTTGEPVLTAAGGLFIMHARGEETFRLTVPVKGGLELWSPDNPALYGLVISAEQDGKAADRCCSRFGWRQFSIRGRKFLLNGKEIRIKGDSWHFMGVPQMTRRYAGAWYRMLKDANGNGIRLHAQVYPRFYLETADEMGVCILDESAIWFSDHGSKMDSDALWDACRNHVKGMVLRDRNHPSVMGWSVCNETVEVARMVLHAPKKLVDRNVAEIREWIAITRELDPTRDWISGDGEIYGKTGLPTLIEHYAWRGFYPLFSLLRKPWGTGETGMAYFGSPRQISKVNGHRAYESQQGRMEGVAGEAFDLITAQRKSRSSYSSVFNLVWYGLKPLALGLDDTGRPPELTDGIFFGEYREGAPGYQPERLGPYCSTLNPGYDPDLLLYEPWPLFDAAETAFADDYRQKKNIWRVKKDSTVKIAKGRKKHGAVWLSGSGKGGLKRRFEDSGLRFGELIPRRRQLILIDGAEPPQLNRDESEELHRAMEQGSTLFVWCAEEAAGELIESLTGSPVVFHRREASSYLVRGGHPVVRGESHESLYFSEISETPLSLYSIGGRWGDEGNTILEACPADWKKWNYQGEDVKTAKVCRSEREKKNSGNVMVRQSCGDGELIVSTLNLFALTSLAEPRVASMMRNLGAPVRGRVRKNCRALNRRGLLTRVSAADHSGEKTVLTARRGGRIFPGGKAGRDLSFRIYSPRALDDLLLEPGVPRLDMLIRGDAAAAWELNGQEMTLSPMVTRGSRSSYAFEGVPLKKGWNHIVLKTGQDGSSSFRLVFKSSRRNFLQKLKSSTDK